MLNIIHRDIKLANIFIHDNRIKIGDLGFAKRLDNKYAMTETRLGTPMTMAPEILNSRLIETPHWICVRP